jgi:putative transposase
MHLVQRGHNGEPCFLDAADRADYLTRLLVESSRRGVSIHAYVLMENHIHLLATAFRSEGISRMFQAVNATYGQAFNHRHARCGTLWGGRHFGCPIESDAYLWRCHRYIELNPVRAGLTSAPEAFKWSSHRSNAFGHPDPLVTPHPEYLSLGDDDEQRSRAYRQMFASPDPDLAELREHLARQCALGSQRFVDGVEADSGRSARLRRPGRPRKQAGINGL